MKNLLLITLMLLSIISFSQNSDSLLFESRSIITKHYYFTLSYPKEAAKHGIQGTVYVKFDVDSTCSLINRIVEKPLGHGLDEIAINSLDNMEKSLKKDYHKICPKRKDWEIPVKFILD